MHIRTFTFGTFRNLFEPRKPRHPLVRLAAGLAGLAILAVLVVFGLFVGTAMVLAGVAWKLLSQRGKRAGNGDRAVVDAEYEVVRKPVLPYSR